MSNQERIAVYSRQLRKEMTMQERKLWYLFLRDYQFKFRRQVVKHNYIIDFYCPTVKLGIEIDGSQHYNEVNMLYDKQRTSLLATDGIKIVRLTNTDVDYRFNEVRLMIDDVVRGLMRV